jgi:hypothetical protein
LLVLSFENEAHAANSRKLSGPIILTKTLTLPLSALYAVAIPAEAAHRRATGLIYQRIDCRSS